MKNIDKTNNNLEKIENCINLAEKTYIYSFDKKNEQYTFTELN